MRRFERLGEEFSDDVLKKALPRLSYKSLEDALAAVGRNELPIDNVLKATIDAFRRMKRQLDLHAARRRSLDGDGQEVAGG